MNQILENSEIKINIKNNEKKGISYLTLFFNGKLSVENIRLLSDGLKEVFENDDSDGIFVDLSKLSYVNSTGLALLLSMWKRAKEKNQKIFFLDIHPFLNELFELTELNQKFVIVENFDKAFELLI